MKRPAGSAHRRQQASWPRYARAIADPCAERLQPRMDVEFHPRDSARLCERCAERGEVQLVTGHVQHIAVRGDSKSGTPGVLELVLRAAPTQIGVAVQTVHKPPALDDEGEVLPDRTNVGTHLHVAPPLAHREATPVVDHRGGLPHDQLTNGIAVQ